MDTAKNILKSVTDSGSQFAPGHKVPIQQQKPPGLESKLNPAPQVDHVPGSDGQPVLYKAAGKLQGRKAIITGGDSGIGRSTAVLFAMEGAESLIAYLPSEEDDAQDTKKMVEKHGGTVHLIALDLKEKTNCQKVIDTAIEKMGAINILFNNHAYQMMTKDITDIPEEQWEFTFQTNIHSFFYLVKYAIPHMRFGDVIINNASVNAYIGRPDLLDYTSTKGAIIAFTRGVSNQYVDKGIRCNALAPGPVWTPLVAATMTKEALDQFTAPMGRPSQPSEIATCAVFLASSDSSSLSGQTIHCNGGVVVNG